MLYRVVVVLAALGFVSVGAGEATAAICKVSDWWCYSDADCGAGEGCEIGAGCGTPEGAGICVCDNTRADGCETPPTITSCGPEVHVTLANGCSATNGGSSSTGPFPTGVGISSATCGTGKDAYEAAGFSITGCVNAAQNRPLTYPIPAGGIPAVGCGCVVTIMCV